MFHKRKNIKHMFFKVLLIKFFCTDDRFSKPVFLYRGKNVVYKFILTIIIMIMFVMILLMSKEYDYFRRVIKSILIRI